MPHQMTVQLQWRQSPHPVNQWTGSDPTIDDWKSTVDGAQFQWRRSPQHQHCAQCVQWSLSVRDWCAPKNSGSASCSSVKVIELAQCICNSRNSAGLAVYQQFTWAFVNSSGEMRPAVMIAVPTLCGTANTTVDFDWSLASGSPFSISLGTWLNGQSQCCRAHTQCECSSSEAGRLRASEIFPVTRSATGSHQLQRPQVALVIGQCHTQTVKTSSLQSSSHHSWPPVRISGSQRSLLTAVPQSDHLVAQWSALHLKCASQLEVRHSVECRHLPLTLNVHSQQISDLSVQHFIQYSLINSEAVNIRASSSSSCHPQSQWVWYKSLVHSAARDTKWAKNAVEAQCFNFHHHRLKKLWLQEFSKSNAVTKTCMTVAFETVHARNGYTVSEWRAVPPLKFTEGAVIYSQYVPVF